MAIASGFPDATNTGVPSGTALKAYNGDLIVTTNGAVISGLDIKGAVYINADNVTLVNCRVTDGNFAVVNIKGRGATVQNCEINGTGTGDNSTGINGAGTFIRNNIYNVENGINVTGSVTIKDNYIHDLKAASDPHYDGIQIDGGSSNSIISHNTVINAHDQTSAVMMDNYFGGLSNTTVDNNYLVGGGYTVYLDTRFNGGTVNEASIKISNNKIDSGHYGDFAFFGSHPSVLGNIEVNPGDVLTGGSLGGGTTTPPPVVVSPPVVVPPVVTAPPPVTTPAPGSGTPVPLKPGTGIGTAGADIMTSGTHSASQTWNCKSMGGNDTIKSGIGADKIDGGTGADTVSYAASNAAVTVHLDARAGWGGYARGDTLTNVENVIGSRFNDTISATKAVNVINAGNGNDRIDGHGGNDTLTGGAGADTFIFTAALKTAGIAKITDFSAVDDRIQLDNHAFTAFKTLGALSASDFYVGTKAHDANDHIIYNAATGALSYDADGTGSAAQVQFATLAPHLAVTHADFFII